MKKSEQFLKQLPLIKESGDYSNDTMESYVREYESWHDIGKKINVKLKEAISNHPNKPELMETYRNMRDCHTTMGESLKTMKRKMK